MENIMNLTLLQMTHHFQNQILTIVEKRWNHNYESKNFENPWKMSIGLFELPKKQQKLKQIFDSCRTQQIV